MGSSVSPPPASGVRSTKHDRKRKPEKVIDSDPNSSDSDSDSENGNGVVDSTVQDDDIPVLSHAARRKQMKQAKRRQREEESDGIDSAGPKKKRKLSGGRVKDAADRDITRKNSVWVGNMTFKTTEEDLKAFFKDRGLSEVTRVNMPTKAGAKPGFKSENRG
jgi:RNA recognition motif-containing protein